MDKTFNNLMDIVSRTKKIDEKEGRVSRPKTRIENDTPSFDEPKKEIKPAKTSLFEGKDAINKYLSSGKKKETKKETKKSTKKTTSKKSTKTTSKKSSTKSTKSTKSTTKEKDKNVAKDLLKNIDDATQGITKEEKKAKAKDIADKFQLINKKKVVKPTKQAPVLDMNDPKNVELYNALKETLLAGGTDVSEYMTEGVTAKQLGNLLSQKKAQNINDEITREQQEYEKLFTGSFFDEGTTDGEEMTDASLQEYFAKQQESANNSDNENTMEETNSVDEMSNSENISSNDNNEVDNVLPRRNRFDSDLEEYSNRDRELDEKIADYYKRKQEKINEYTKSQMEEAYTEEKKEEKEDIDYEDVFNGEIEKRSVVLGEEEEEEESIENVQPEEPQETDFQSLYHSLNADNFEEYTERYVTPASEQIHGETFVSEKEPVEENEEIEKSENLESVQEDENEEMETSYNQTFTDDELVHSEMQDAKDIDENDDAIDDVYNLSEEDNLDDYIVSSNIPYESNNTDDEDNTMVINSNDLPENKLNYFDEDLDEENGERIIDGDAISKQEFYSEMARLQENLINQLKSENKEQEPKEVENTVTTNATLDKALDIINNLTQTKPEVKPTLYDAKADKVANQLIEEIDKDMKIEQLMEEDPASESYKEKTQIEDDNQEKDYNKIFESVEEIPEEKQPEQEVEEIEFNGDSLLNKDVALNDSDLQYIVNSEKLKSEKKDYFYMSEEDKEKKKEDESYIQKTKDLDGKEMGDINLNKDIANAIPSTEIIENEEKPAQRVDDMELIHTIFGVQKKKIEKIDSETKVLYVTSECLPFVATGGLADVSGSLPKAINKLPGVDVRVILPLYGQIKNEYADKLEYICNFTVHLSWRQEYCGLFKYTLDGVTYYFVDNERYFKRNSLYGFYDDGERFAYFCKAVVEGLPMLNFFPDIIHCNDWQSALVSTYIKTGNWSDFRYYKIKNIYTIHNVEYQGIYGMENLKDLFGIDYRFKNDLDYNGDINLTKSAIQFSDKFTTVSNSYCDNLKQPYCSRGLNHIIVRNEYKLSGIINGIDLDYYNPATDSVVYKNYDVNSLDDKVYNKKILQDELGLPVDAKTPLIGMATRLVSHKGLDLVTKILESVLEKDVQFIIVGTGDQRYIDYFKYLENKYPTKVRALVDKYSNENARKLYAASDMFLMPSKIEPCGISQMIASRYGSIPIVREVGGLKDTIKDFGCAGGGNGYTFANYNPEDLKFQINRAINDYRDEVEWKRKMKTVMSVDFSWENSARKYVELYKSLVD